MKTVKYLTEEFRNQLSFIYQKGELEQIIFLAFEYVCNFSKTDLILKRDEPLTDEKSDELSKILKRLTKQEPIQYIIGTTEFYGLTFKVNKHVLIPRQETEELVDLIIKESVEFDHSKKINILDICTGSGCIAIALKKNIPQSTVYALDISEDALKVAEENSKLNQMPINFIQDDIFNLKSKISNLKSSFDIIVSNPPYVMKSEMKEMTARELNYEPHLAFFVQNEDPLMFHRQIAALATRYLKPGGKLYFEINELKGKEIFEMLTGKEFKEVTLKQDLNGKDRMVSCRFK